MRLRRRRLEVTEGSPEEHEVAQEDGEEDEDAADDEDEQPPSSASNATSGFSPSSSLSTSRSCKAIRS